MTELRNIQADLSRFRLRVLIIAIVVVVAFGLVAARLVYLQVFRHEDLAEQAESNRTAIVPIVPNRGLILDRNGVVLATNYSAYTLEITPSRVADLEQTIDALSKVVDIHPRDRRRFKKLQEESKSFESLPIRTRLTDEEVARFAAQRFHFPGVEIKARLFRNYPFGELASHVIGYIGRINQSEKERIQESEDAANYRGTDYIGKLGVEQSYETQLHGITGVEEIETSAGGRAVRRLASTPATPGNTVVLSIDIKLQKLVEDLFGERRGALVALDPKTGEVLAFVSKPTFDPNLFVDGIDQENWQELNESLDKPLLNRALRGTYPPGSTYKPFMALAALETGKRTPQQTIQDPGYFMFGNHRFRDDKEGGHGTVDMYKSIVQSCDTYYYVLANDMGVDLMHDELQKFGFGAFTGIDIQGEVRGLLPSTEWKRKAYKRPEQQKWYAGETISLGIGQGYNNFTMLQLALATGVIANDGIKMKPHLVKEVVDVVTRTSRETLREIKAEAIADPKNIAVIRNALVGVNTEGTGATAFRGAGYVAAGKTGTAQVVAIKQNEKYNAARMAERLRDHALYMAFAPADKPKIALAMVVENAGFGGAMAAPIARRVFDYWLLGQSPTPEDMAAVQKGQAGPPPGAPRPPASAASAPASASTATPPMAAAASAVKTQPTP
ncbi:MAG: penicillin-binding protein 2 [Comamonadaceae bacterium]|jgi:penicillin-binding protein 2|uniref:penicillin-binding protein 2 n=1 Tax=Candidatus Skiveiella danica TaxID=3386177 RepID=UPI001B7BB13C|nr:penicillin-binding protein 2 [Comamonadaceae bacterium]MBK9199149.1 penicillin-binding protein 2 [Betaproteobacteria bacterium]MBP6307985.1 penicillin-binding protein 2 [Burkholderiaceae bacterium]MBK6928002.1 penicillin-binding protein 2 [Comamonadaceae bacterium]MBK7990016.1 penicillin-binding protein 2 [Comamonadaceae bacterium]